MTMVLLFGYVVYPFPSRSSGAQGYLEMSIEFLNIYDIMQLFQSLACLKKIKQESWILFQYISMGISGLLLSIPLEIRIDLFQPEGDSDNQNEADNKKGADNQSGADNSKRADIVKGADNQSGADNEKRADNQSGADVEERADIVKGADNQSGADNEKRADIVNGADNQRSADVEKRADNVKGAVNESGADNEKRADVVKGAVNESGADNEKRADIEMGAVNESGADNENEADLRRWPEQDMREICMRIFKLITIIIFMNISFIVMRVRLLVEYEDFENGYIMTVKNCIQLVLHSLYLVRQCLALHKKRRKARKVGIA